MGEPTTNHKFKFKLNQAVAQKLVQLLHSKLLTSIYYFQPWVNLRLAVQSLTSNRGSKTIFNSSLTLCLVLTGDPVFNPGLVLLTLHTIISNKAA